VFKNILIKIKLMLLRALQNIRHWQNICFMLLAKNIITYGYFKLSVNCNLLWPQELCN